jgi:hypothetical protein
MSADWNAMEEWNTLSDKKTFTTYCLGGPISMSKCKTCQHDVNWKSLNELPDALRKKLQGHLERISESQCAITNGTLYKQKV